MKYHYLSQGNSGWTVNATVSYDTGPTVTVEITYNSIGWGWRIRGTNPDTSVYLTGSSGTWYGTFDATNGKSYAFQVYDQAAGSFSNGHIFTVDFESDSGSSGSGSGGSSESYYHFYIDEGEGTSVEVVRTWDESAVTGSKEIIYNGTPIVWKDWFDVTVRALNGYKDPKLILNNFEIESTKTNSDGSITYHGTMSTVNDIHVSSTATINQFNLTLNEGDGTGIVVTRISSQIQTASIGQLANGATIYYGDVLKIEYGLETGYKIGTRTINGFTFNSGTTHTVTEAVTVVTTGVVQSFKLYYTKGNNYTITVRRNTSPLQNASVGYLNPQEIIYYGDVLEITFSTNAGYKLTQQTINGEELISGDLHTVTSDVEIILSTETMGLVYIDSGAGWEAYLVYIDNGAGWEQYIPYIDTGSGWNICS
jgi:hypothetical protein